jgi:acyl-CoA synthetase (AMP-forming)/AMP-acid ligase II
MPKGPPNGYRQLPGREGGLELPEIAVFSGDIVRKDSEGFLYFIGRRDDMIKTSGYRVSPTEIEEVLYGTQLVGEVAAFGVPHPTLGQSIVVIVTPKGDNTVDTVVLLAACRDRASRSTWCRAGSIVRSGTPSPQPERQDRPQALRLEFEGAFNVVEST